ncbi:MAG: hypothetical protein COC10_06130 [Sphingobium sp.]|nr:MAG: hypothetical protein COC10_06130 [Sphingobium sp.]
MSAFSSLAGSTMADSWPMTRVMAGMSAVPVGHAIDLAYFFPRRPSPHDALIAETRRHLGGCVAAIETGLRVLVDHIPEVSSALESWPDLLCWRMICDQPTLICPPLLAHMRMRAGVSLMLRYGGAVDAAAQECEHAALPETDPALADGLAALALAEGRWMSLGGENQPMRPDLPAEHFAELMWAVVACLAAVARRNAPEGGDRLLAGFERAGWAMLADHDESMSPLMEADRLVRQLGEQSAETTLLDTALSGRRFLMFAGLAANRLRMEITQVVDILVTGPLPPLAMLCRALGGSDADYRHLLLALRPGRPELTDVALVAAAAEYQALSEQDAHAGVAALRTPASLRAKLGHLLGAMAA